MTWQGFYLVCFAVGFALALLTFLTGVLHWPLGHGLHVPHLFTHSPPAAGGAHGAPGHGADGGSALSPFNFATVMAFLAWFGGTGYLLTGGGQLSHLIVLGLASAGGLVGGLIVSFFLARVLLRHERVLQAADFDMIGVLGRVTMPIREGGTGEIVYSQEGTRRSTGARSEGNAAIARGSEVVVTRYEKGIAYVRRWEELAGGDEAIAHLVDSNREEEK